MNTRKRVDYKRNNGDTSEVYSVDNQPPYPVSSVNGQTGDVTVDVPVKSVVGLVGDVKLYTHRISVTISGVNSSIDGTYSLVGVSPSNMVISTFYVLGYVLFGGNASISVTDCTYILSSSNYQGGKDICVFWAVGNWHARVVGSSTSYLIESKCIINDTCKEYKIFQ